MRMEKQDVYGNALACVVLIVTIASIIFGLSLLHSHPLLPLIILISCSPIAFLVCKNPDYKVGSISSFKIVSFLLILNGVVSLYCLFDHQRELSILNKYFFGGKIHKEEVWSEGDEDHEPGYETEYTYIGKQSTLKDIFEWTYLVSVLLTPFITYQILKSMPEFNIWKSNTKHDSDW
jgi:hypothetical protein